MPPRRSATRAGRLPRAARRTTKRRQPAAVRARGAAGAAAAEAPVRGETMATAEPAVVVTESPVVEAVEHAASGEPAVNGVAPNRRASRRRTATEPTEPPSP